MGHSVWAPFSVRYPNPRGIRVRRARNPAVPATISGGLLDYNNNVANANYNGLTVTVLERLGQLFNLTANYTYSHTIDNGNFTTFINLPPNQFDYASERANSNQDIRNNLLSTLRRRDPSTVLCGISSSAAL